LCGPAKRNVLSLFLFCVMRRLCPNPSIEIKILPLGFQDLAHSGSCQHLESNGIGRADIWVVLQYPDQARKLFVREPSVTLFLPIPLDPLGGVVSPPTPLDGQIEHFRDQGEHPVGLIWPVAQTEVHRLDIPALDRRNFLGSNSGENNILQHGTIVSNALRAFLGNGMAFEVIEREVGHVRRLSIRPTVPNRILSTQGVGENAARAPFLGQNYDTLAEIARATGCGLLLDVNNVFVSALNHATSPHVYLGAFPSHLAEEIHLAGHFATEDGQGSALCIDAHQSPVIDDVLALFESIIARTGPLPTLVEWDNDLPEWSPLLAEVIKAQERLDRAAHAYAAAAAA
jgi:hypothetical protein